LSGKGDVFALTLSSNHKIAEGLKIIPEIRYDITSESSFSDDGTLKDNLGSILIAAVYSF